MAGLVDFLKGIWMLVFLFGWAWLIGFSVSIWSSDMDMLPVKMLVEGGIRSWSAYGGMVLESSNMVVDCAWLAKYISTWEFFFLLD